MAGIENVSYYVPLRQPIVFTLEGFIITRQQGFPLFAVTLIVFAVMLLGNIIVIAVIAADAKLHKPMYVMMCNLEACDLLGGTVVMTQLMHHFLTGDKAIRYLAAIVQAFWVHTYGAASNTILAAMAYDRYVAICQPLHYHNIMTTKRLVLMCFLAWSIPICLVTILFMLHVGTPICRTLILHVYCSNRSILRLACVPTPINNFYDVCVSWILGTACFLVTALSYTKILKTCVINQEKNCRSKALQTCASHLIIFIIFEISAYIIIITQRFPEVSPNAQKFSAILFIIVPPTVNPIIYGIAMKHIRASIVKFFKYSLTKMVRPINTTQLSK